jgi:hypothetical protein
MQLPFTPDGFFAVFADYNQAFGMAVVALWLLSVLGVAISCTRSCWTRALALAGLGTVLFACGGPDNAPTGPSSPSSPPLSSLELFPPQLVVLAGSQFTLNVIARDVGGADVPDVVPSYSSSNPGAVRVDPGGELVAIGVGTATVGASAGGQAAEAVIHVGAATYDVISQGSPRVLNANYIDLSKIGRVSRFRSTIGHSYTNDTGDETCRSMKHYFEPKMSVDWTTVDIYAPVTGTVGSIRVDGRGYQIGLRPRDLPALNVALFHVNPDPGVVINAWVEAGDHLGRHASPFTLSDIATGIGPKVGGTLLSYFEVMTDAVFAEYQARGVPSREAAIITRVERDADPVPCVGEQQFTVQGTLPGWLVLN